MLKVGSQAPEFHLPDEQGVQHSLADLLRDGPILLYFYPADFTPVCTAQACALRDIVASSSKESGPDLAMANQSKLQVVGVSAQGADSHRRFKERYNLPFTLLSDVDKTVVRAYGVQGPFGFGVRRATFVIDQQQCINQRVVSDFFVEPHAELLR